MYYTEKKISADNFRKNNWAASESTHCSSPYS